MAKKVRFTVVLVAIMAIGAIFASSAFAECGPGFSSKSRLIRVIKHNPGIAHGMRKELLAEPRSEYQADETVLNYVRQSNQEVFNAPSGYMLTANTYCPGGYGDYQPYGGLLENMSGLPLLWHCDKEGKNCIPLLKGYCMNFVHGPPVKKHHPPRHHPHKCGCKKHHPHHKKPKPKPPTCASQGLIGTAGNCVQQSNNAKQECEAKVNGQWNGSQCTIVQVNANCSNVAGNESGTVIQGGNCNTTIIVEEHSCSSGCETHWTEISCTSFEEVSGGGSFLVDCGVSDDNGAQISLAANSNDENSRVSGINCYSNGGSQTCPSGGTFEFRVSGINNGSSILSSSVTVTASANGVKAPFVLGPFPVDPREGGF